MILSVSRRTDIPAFYSDWFFEQLNNGFVLVPNPINPKQIARIKLEPIKKNVICPPLLADDTRGIDSACMGAVESGTIEGIVFWTKNPQPMIGRLNELGDIKYYFLYTLNAYPQNIESGLPTIDERIKSFKELSKHCPVIWRYDPILMSDSECVSDAEGGQILLTDGITVEWHIKQFKSICEQLNGCTEHCKISFVIKSYSGCSKSVYAPTEKQKHEILSAFSKIARGNNIQIEACAESGDWSQYGIVPSKCIDGEIFEKLLNAKRKNNKLDGQRRHCGCMPAVDIGQYDTCRHGCNYCYARRSRASIFAEQKLGRSDARKGKPKSIQGDSRVSAAVGRQMTDKLNGDIYERKAEIVFDYLS